MSDSYYEKQQAEKKLRDEFTAIKNELKKRKDDINGLALLAMFSVIALLWHISGKTKAINDLEVRLQVTEEQVQDLKVKYETKSVLK